MDDETRNFLHNRALGSAIRPVVLLVMANKGNRDLVDNLLCSLHAVGIERYVLFASDEESFNFYKIHGYR